MERDTPKPDKNSVSKVADASDGVDGTTASMDLCQTDDDDDEAALQLSAQEAERRIKEARRTAIAARIPPFEIDCLIYKRPSLTRDEALSILVERRIKDADVKERRRRNGGDPIFNAPGGRRRTYPKVRQRSN